MNEPLESTFSYGKGYDIYVCTFLTRMSHELHSQILLSLFLSWTFEKVNLARNILFITIQHSSEDVCNHMLLKLSFVFSVTAHT